MQRTPAQWIIIAAISMSIILILMPSSSSDQPSQRRITRVVPHDREHHEHEHVKPVQPLAEDPIIPPPVAKQPNPHAHHEDTHAGAEHEGKKPTKQAIVPWHVDHGGHQDILFRMPEPGMRADLLEAVINPEQGFYGGEKTGMNDHHNPMSVMWQAPPGTPQGVLLLFHGCNHDGSDWFNGPVERRIVAHALAQGLVTVALQAGMRHGAKCWKNDWPVVINADVIAVKSCLKHFFEEHLSWRKLALFGLGASSGGTFINILSRVVPFTAIAIQVSPGLREAMAYSSALLPLPAMAFIYMSGDTTWATKLAVQAQLQRLIERNIPARSYEATPKLLTVQMLYSYLDLNKDRVERVHEKLIEHGVIDKDGKLLEDPRSHLCGKVAVKALSEEDPGYNWARWEYGIQELANVAEGVHELTFEWWPEALAWMRIPHE